MTTTGAAASELSVTEGLMFEGFANVWTAVTLSQSLRQEAVGMSIASTPVVLFRDAQGRARGLVDRCPHRGVALSLGKVEDGC